MFSMVALLWKSAPFWIIRKLPVFMPPEAVTIRGYPDDSQQGIERYQQNQDHLPTSICISQYCVQNGPDVLPGVKDFDKGAVQPKHTTFTLSISPSFPFTAG